MAAETEQPPAAPLASVRTVGRYEVLRELGRGSMGRVFLARDPAIGRQVALKTVSVLEGFPDEERREARHRFIQEARTAGNLLHPNIITIFDVGEQDGMPFIAMEYVEGGTLEKHCRPPDLLEPEKAVALIVQAARALNHAHAHQIVHRDIKPANLMLVGGHQIKVADFGLAKTSTASLTTEGTILGTPYYMSPEQLSGEELDGRSDLFSLTVVLYELLTGRRPFEAKDISAILYQVAHEPAPPPERQGWPISQALRETLERALSKQREERYPSGEALARALELALRGGRAMADNTAVLPARRFAGIGEEAPAERRPPSSGARRAQSERPGARSGAAPRASGAIPAPGHASASGGRWLVAAFAGAALGLFPTLVNRSRVVPAAEPAPRQVAVDLPVEVPQNARLRLDGVPLAGLRVPASVLLEPGHRLEVETPCERAETLLRPGEPLPALQMTPRTRQLALASTPSGAQLWVNGIASGLQTPARLDLTLCAAHRLELRMEGFEPLRLALEAGQDWAPLVASPLGLSRVPEGKVWIPAAPYEIQVLHKGHAIGRAGQLLTLPRGPTLLVLRNEKLFLERPVDVLVRPGETHTVQIDFAAPGSLSVQAHPSNCRISVDGREVGAPPVLDLPVAAGSHLVRCVLLTTGEEKTQKVTVQTGRNSTCQFKFTEALAPVAEAPADGGP
jgi:hypothetical protein